MSSIHHESDLRRAFQIARAEEKTRKLRITDPDAEAVPPKKYHGKLTPLHFAPCNVGDTIVVSAHTGCDKFTYEVMTTYEDTMISRDNAKTAVLTSALGDVATKPVVDRSHLARHTAEVAYAGAKKARFEARLKLKKVVTEKVTKQIEDTVNAQAKKESDEFLASVSFLGPFNFAFVKPETTDDDVVDAVATASPSPSREEHVSSDDSVRDISKSMSKIRFNPSDVTLNL